MLFRPALIALLCGSLLALSPVSSWSRPSQEGYDCVKTGKSGYRCVKGPLAGQTFPSQKAMILALTKSPSGQNGADKTKIEKISQKKGKTNITSPKKSKKR